MERRDFLRNLGAAAAAAGVAPLTGCSSFFNPTPDTRHPTPNTRHPTPDTRHPTHSSPNIVVVMIDDAGFSDIGCFGSEIPTPNIDALAERGLRMTHFYTESICAPTRGAFLTGLYAHQAGFGSNNVGRNEKWNQLGPAYAGPRPDDHMTVADALRAAGYQTFMTGKWHHGDHPHEWPVSRGFDRSFVMVYGGGSHYAPPGSPYALDRQPFTEFPEDFYTTDYFTKYAIQFIEEADRDRPFFLFLSHSSPHSPYQDPPEGSRRFEGMYGEHGDWQKTRAERLEKQKELGLFPEDTQAAELLPLAVRHQDDQRWGDDRPTFKDIEETYAAMVYRIDEQVGELVKTLKRLGEEENTLIVFLSDNGPAPARGLHWCQTAAVPHQGWKGSLYEGGIRAPFIACWPGRIPEGVIERRQVGHVMDLFPTFLDAAGAELPRTYRGHAPQELEGISLLPYWTKPGRVKQRILCWEQTGNSAIRGGDWKLVRYYPHGVTDTKSNIDDIAPWELYNLADDPSERHNLAEQYPARVAELERLWHEWADRVGVVSRKTIGEALRKSR